MPFVSTEGDTPERNYCCPEPDCGRRFNRKYTMIEHSKIHTGEKPHVCPVRTCGKRFSTSGNLSRHKRLHATIDPLPCPAPGCRSTFESANKLEKHMKFHRGDAVHVCAINFCGKTFSTTGNLNRHIRNHHGSHSNATATSDCVDAAGESLSDAAALDQEAVKEAGVFVAGANAAASPVAFEGLYADSTAGKVGSILDDVISFHVAHLSRT